MNELKSTQQRWQESSCRFVTNIKADLFDAEEVRIWKDIIYENAPKNGKMRILDIGTGPGFFAIILSMDGHDVTGIDCTPGMLVGAGENAKAYGTSPEFRQMDCHELEFAANTFDLIVSRNVSWTLFDPVRAYAEWKRVLKPGGRMLIFDANWYMNFFDAETKKNFDAGVLEYREKYGDLPRDFSMYLIEDYWRKLPLAGIKRPDWDRATLWKLGFSNTKFECNLDDRLYTRERSKLLYGSTPMFMISADKPTSATKCHEEMLSYWNSVSLEWGIACLKEFNSPQRDAYKKLFEPYIKGGCSSVLDIGTGGGFLAMLFADMGFSVTGTDLCPEMLEQAKYTAEKLNFNISFIQADAEKLPFDDGSFDMIVCRNVTWLLSSPETAFREWARVLTSGGRLVFVDANWNLYMYDEQEYVRFEENRRLATEKGEEKLYGNGHSSTEMIDRLSKTLPFSKIRRPGWDKSNLPGLGFEIVEIRENISEEICTEQELLRTAATPMFIVCADKK